MTDFKNNHPFLLQDFSFWQNQKLYFQLMEKFVSNQINGREFHKEFCKMWRIDRDNKSNLKKSFDILNNQELTKLEGFSAPLSRIFVECDVFEPDWSLRDNYSISEEELKNYVKKTLLEMKKRYN